MATGNRLVQETIMNYHDKVQTCNESDLEKAMS
jgi:hypothetical protein